MLPRLYPILDAGTLERARFPAIDAARAMIDAGIGILQWRSKAPLTRTSLEQAEAVADLCARRGVTFVVNDRADVAMLIRSGLHLGQDDLRPSDARRLLGPDTPIGFSTHNEAQLKAAAFEPVDYVALGPVFSTVSKERPDPVVGLEQFARWRELTMLPLVAIGGITLENALDVMEAGADSVAVIGGLIPAEVTAHGLRRRVEEWLTLLG